MYRRIVIGLDQSYTRCGVSIAADGKLLKVKSIDFKNDPTKTDKRKRVAETLRAILTNVIDKATEVEVICERIRTFSTGPQQPKGEGDAKSPGMFISTAYIQATGALIATIVDTAHEFGVKVYSVDTRSWKSQVLGSSKKSPDEDTNKDKAIKFVTALGFDVSYTKKRSTKIHYNDDAADSACIALYGFVTPAKRRLNPED
jgi:hypothetical protein